VKTAFVCEVAFGEWTLDGELRQTTFLGWRDDKDPEEVVLEQAEKAEIRKWRFKKAK
jgi:bifunctional non-homologous end joining protein LigD